jgi:hypothetical protein
MRQTKTYTLVASRPMRPHSQWAATSVFSRVNAKRSVKGMFALALLIGLCISHIFFTLHRWSATHNTRQPMCMRRVAACERNPLDTMPRELRLDQIQISRWVVRSAHALSHQSSLESFSVRDYHQRRSCSCCRVSRCCRCDASREPRPCCRAEIRLLSPLYSINLGLISSKRGNQDQAKVSKAFATSHILRCACLVRVGVRLDGITKERRIVALIRKFARSPDTNPLAPTSLLFFFIKVVESVDGNAGGDPGDAEGRNHDSVTELVPGLSILIPVIKKINR